jgi:hypothetical protein
MFRENQSHLQRSLLDSSSFMNDRIHDKLMKTWAAPFYEHVFCQIDETPFACLYCADNGRPNFPVNILLSLEFIKQLKNYTDEELIDQFYFNYQVSYAVGLHCLGELHLGPRTLYDFRERVYRYALENPGEEDLIFGQFSTLTTHFIEVLQLNTKEQRTDSTMIMPNIKWAGRLSLAYDVLTQAAKACPESILSKEIKTMLEAKYKKELLYRTKSSETKTKLETMLALGQQLLTATMPYPNLQNQKEIHLLKRFLNEQSDFDQASGHRVAKDSRDISPDSLQSAYDPDATYREKSGKKHKGYVANLIETCNQDNPIQVVTDYHLAANTTSDVELLKERLPILKENMFVQDIYADGGYYGEEALQLAQDTDVNLHFTNMTGRKTNSHKLPLTDFGIDEENYRITTCPAGHAPLHSGRAKRSGSITAHFNRQQCQACPNKDRCPVKFQKKSAVLRITSKALHAARTRIQLEDRASRLEATSKRAAIEGTNSALKRGHGAAKLAVCTQAKSQTVFGLKVIGHNFRQFVRGLMIMAGRQAQDSEVPALSGGSLCFCS